MLQILFVVVSCLCKLRYACVASIVAHMTGCSQGGGGTCAMLFSPSTSGYEIVAIYEWVDLGTILLFLGTAMLTNPLSTTIGAAIVWTKEPASDCICGDAHQPAAAVEMTAPLPYIHDGKPLGTSGAILLTFN